ncbi:MAG: hypothetical protein K2M48_05100 [Clostridiales bacterium]|nr:hypothetical protein [Clostridiales bacterium]
MERRDYIGNVLVRSGFRTSLKGFDQFCKCLELYADDRTSTMSAIYSRVSSDFRCSKSSVEKNLRRLFIGADASGVIGRLFGTKFSDASVKEIVALFCNYVELNRDSYSAS